MTKIIEAVILSDHIMADFNERGFAADFVYYELLERVEQWYEGNLKTEDLVEHLEFTMGFEDEKHFEVVLKKANKVIKDIKAMIDGTYDPEAKDE